MLNYCLRVQVPGPPKPLSSHEWQDVERASNARGDSDQPCPICLEPFKMKEQVLGLGSLQQLSKLNVLADMFLSSSALLSALH